MNQTEGAKLIQYIKIMIHTMKRPELIQMKKDDPIEFKRFMLENFTQLRDKSLTLFEMVLDKGENFDLPRFAKMMNLRDQVFENKSTTYEEASKKLGQEYFDEFVKPNLHKAKTKKEQAKENKNKK